MLFCRFLSIHPFIFHRLHGVSSKIICALLFPHLRHHSSSASPLPFILSYYSSSLYSTFLFHLHNQPSSSAYLNLLVLSSPPPGLLHTPSPSHLDRQQPHLQVSIILFTILRSF